MTQTNTVHFHPWQQSIIDVVEAHEVTKDSEQYQGISDYAINRQTGVFVSHPKGAGHTFLASYLASKYPSLLVYGRMNHYNDLIGYFKPHAETETVSTYELFYAIHKQDAITPTVEFLEVRRRFDNKEVIIVDNAMSISSELRDFIYGVSQGIVIQLGH